MTLAVAVFSTGARAQAVDTVYPDAPVGEYFVLDAYKLEEDQEAQFDAEDEQISPFWEEWENGDKTLDQIEINCTYTGNYLGYEHSKDGFTGEDDARMWVRAAWGVDGVYLYIKVRDDQFVTNAVTRNDGDGNAHTAAEASWYNDAIDMYVDKFSTEMLYSQEDVLFTNFNRDRKTKFMRQIQYQFGEIGTAPETFSYNQMVQSDDGRFVFAPDREFTFDRAKTEANGLVAEIISGSEKGLGDTAQVMEWHLPWEQIGTLGGLQPPDEGETVEFAFACGYNDADEGATDSDFIRWVRATDPFKRIPPPEGGDHVPTDGWGDIRLVPEGTPVIMPKHAGRTLSAALSRVEYYTPAGRLVASVRADKGAVPAKLSINVPSNTLLLERRITVSGETIAGKRLVTGR
jgi:hypothetical protein